MCFQCTEWAHCGYFIHFLTIYLQCSSSGHWILPPVYGGVIGSGRQAGKRSAQKGVLIPVQSSHSSQPGSSRDPLLSPERMRSPTPLEYTKDDEPMKEVEPDWKEWVPNPYLNRLGKWLAETDLGKPPSDEETAREWFCVVLRFRGSFNVSTL